MLTKNYTPITESYFGKSKYLIEIERLLEIIIKRFTVPFEKVGKRIIDATKVNQSKENHQIEALFCKQFGFKEMILHWSGEDDVNAFTATYGIMTLVDKSKPALPIENNDGSYYDSKHLYICSVNVYAGLVDINLTADEILATILHEIGHNFTCTPLVHFVSVLDWVLIPVNAYITIKHIVNSLNAWDTFKDFTTNGDKSDEAKCIAAGEALMSALTINLYRGYKYFDLVRDGISRFLDRMAGSLPEQLKAIFTQVDQNINANKNRILAEWENVVDQVNKAKKQFEENPNIFGYKFFKDGMWDMAKVFAGGSFYTFQKLIDIQANYSNEVFADSFATAYGYGSAFISAQQKISHYTLHSRLFNKRNKYNVYNQYIYIMSMVLFQFLDEHPGDQTRMRKQIDKMRSELSNENIDPRIRKVLIADLARAEKIYNEYVTKMPPELKHLAVIMNYNQLNEMYFNGKMDIREPINRILNFGKTEA